MAKISFFDELGYLLFVAKYGLARNISEASVDMSWYKLDVLDDDLNLDTPDAQMSSGVCETIKDYGLSMTINLYKEMVEKHKYFVLVICHDVFVKSYSKHMSKSKEHIQMLFSTASMKYDKRPITKSIDLLDVSLKFVWAYTRESL